jgi:molecular chaperone DnaK
VTRTDLESCLIDPLLKTKECIEQAMNDAKLSYSDLNEVVFVGGSTRIPFVSQKVEEWTGIKPNKSINPDEAVSIGAALQASVLSGTSDREIYLLDVCPLSLGIETQGGVMTTLILRNTQVPAVVKQMFTTAYDNQTSVDVKIYQGERPLTKDNLYLGEFELDNIQKAPRGLPKIEVFFEIDANGILSVKAVDEINGTEQQLTISGNNNLSSEEIQKILNDAQENKTSDENLRKLLNLQAQVKDYIIQTEELLRTNKFNEDESRDISELNSSLIKAENTSNFELLYSLIEDARETVSDMIKVLHKKAEESL